MVCFQIIFKHCILLLTVLFFFIALAEDYIYLLDRSEEEDRESEKEKNGTLKSFGSTVSDDSSSTGSLRRRLYANLTSLDDLDGSRYSKLEF